MSSSLLGSISEQTLGAWPFRAAFQETASLCYYIGDELEHSPAGKGKGSLASAMLLVDLASTEAKGQELVANFLEKALWQDLWALYVVTLPTLSRRRAGQVKFPRKDYADGGGRAC